MLVLCSFVFDVESGARKDHQKHHHSEHYYACLKPVSIWILPSLCSRQLYYYFRAYSCFELNESTGFLLNEPAGVLYANPIALCLPIYRFLRCLRGEYVPRSPQRGLSEGVKVVAEGATTLVKQRAVLVKFLSPGSCGSNNLQETMGWDLTDAMFVTYVVASTNVPSTVSGAVGVGNVGAADERGLWNVKSASAASAADIVVTADVGTETYVGDTVRVGLYASERPSTGVGAVGAGIVFSIGAPSGSVEVRGSDAGDGVGASFGVAQLDLQRSAQLTLQLTLQRPAQLTLQLTSPTGSSVV